MEEEKNLIELVDDEGNALKLEHLLTFENNDAFYAAFLPLEEGEEEADEVIIMRLEEDEKGDDVFLPIEDDEELDAAWQSFLSIYYDEEDEEDDDENDENDEGDPGKDELGENE
jgi:uncharacterized protein YrzB (UPF0473 family)